jgi:Ankyrin repeats (3 copies)
LEKFQIKRRIFFQNKKKLSKMQTRSQAGNAAKTANHQPFLPWELIDEILIKVGSWELAIDLERFSIVRKINIKYDFIRAMVNGHLDYLKYLNRRGLCAGEYKKYSLSSCASNGRLNVLKYCHEHIKPITEYTAVLDQAASNGHLDLVKYLHSIGSKCTENAMNRAAGAGHLEIVKFLHENRSEGCNVDAMDMAAFRGGVILRL